MFHTKIFNGYRSCVCHKTVIWLWYQKQELSLHPCLKRRFTFEKLGGSILLQDTIQAEHADSALKRNFCYTNKKDAFAYIVVHDTYLCIFSGLNYSWEPILLNDTSWELILKKFICQLNSSLQQRYSDQRLQRVFQETKEVAYSSVRASTSD